MLALSDGDDWETAPGAVVILRNSSFINNTANDDNGGVVNVGTFSLLAVEGDGNVFEQNVCGQDGGVVASTTDSLVTFEGGTFKGNMCGLVSRVLAAWLP